MKPIIPARLKQARENAGLSVGQAAKLLALSRDELKEIETGMFSFAYPPIRTFSRVYDVSEAWLRGEEKPLVLPPDFVAFLERMPPDERDSLIDLLSSMRQNES